MKATISLTQTTLGFSLHCNKKKYNCNHGSKRGNHLVILRSTLFLLPFYGVMLFNITGVMTIVTFCVLFQSSLVPTQIKCLCQNFASVKTDFTCSYEKLFNIKEGLYYQHRSCVIHVSLVLSVSVLYYRYQSCVICQSKNHTFCECTIHSLTVCMKQLCCQNGVLLTPCPGSFWQLKLSFQ